MCLYTKQILPIRARKDITCYKVVVVSQHNGVKLFRSPYYGVRLYLGEPYVALPINRRLPLLFRRQIIFNGIHMVEEGYSHCYTDYEFAKDRCAFISNEYGSPTTCILECIIPKGTLYFKSDDKIEICAKEILPQDWLMTYERGSVAERNIKVLQKRSMLAKQKIQEKAK
jgi:hypothetical protein